VFKKRQFFSNKTSRCFSSPSLWKPIRNRRSPHDILSLKTISPKTRANNLFSKKKKQGVARIQEQIVSNFTSKQFLFSKCKIKISRFILNRYSFTKLEKERNERMVT
jgi:hypothetical protein